MAIYTGLFTDSTISEFAEKNFEFIIAGPFKNKEKLESPIIQSSKNKENTAFTYSSVSTEEVEPDLTILSLAESYDLISNLDGENYLFKGDDKDINDFCSQLLDLNIFFDFLDDGIIKISSLTIKEYDQRYSDNSGQKSNFHY